MRTVLLTLLALSLAGCSEDLPEGCDDLVDDADDAQQQLIEIGAGQTLCWKGHLRFERELSLTVDGVTLRGIDAAVLDFSGQTSGANGLLVDSVRGITIEDLEVRNTPGDGIRINASEDVIVRGSKVIWDAPLPSAENGAYGLYPVACKRVLIEDCEVQGASDAGFYVGQSEDILVRNNVASRNVAAIEIENSERAEVTGNDVSDNTAGILAFDLPGLPAGNGGHVSIHDNVVHGNDRANFATEGTIVSYVPPGIGIMVVAKDFVEVARNTVRDQSTTGVMIVSYDVVSLLGAGSANDPGYDSLPEGTNVHDNTFENVGQMPLGGLGSILGRTLPQVVWDGKFDEARPDADARKICIRDATLLNFDYEGGLMHPSMDPAPNDCTHPEEAPVCIFDVCTR